MLQDITRGDRHLVIAVAFELKLLQTPLASDYNCCLGKISNQYLAYTKLTLNRLAFDILASKLLCSKASSHGSSHQ
jgi:hypothetical protein